MLSVQLVDRTFFELCGPSCGTGSTGKSPKNIIWERPNPSKQYQFTFFTDFCFEQVDNINNTKYKIAFVREPKSLFPHIYDYIKNNYNKFDYILTYDTEFLKIDPNKFKFCPSAGHWIYDNDIKIHDKSKLLSIIASNKTQLVGHKFRHEIIKQCYPYINGIFGNGYTAIDNKIEGLKDYCFHLVIENDKFDYFFSEKLIDAFITGCVPIYWGCPSIGKFFNEKGIITFNTIPELEDLLNTSINSHTYDDIKQRGILEENMKLAQEYLYPEDYVYNNLLKELL
jgi:hypothetical protein